MRRTINNVIYDTRTSIYIGCFQYDKESLTVYESLYLSPNGRFFIHYRAGPQDSNCKNGTPHFIQRLILLDDRRGLEFAEHLSTEEEFKSIKRLKAFLRNNTGL